MGKELKTIQSILQQYLEEVANQSGSKSDLTYEVLIDRDKNHFQLLRHGWRQSLNMYAVLIHFQIRSNKVWVLQNLTERRVAQDLVSQGISPNDIVLGFQPEHRRPYSGYAVA